MDRIIRKSVLALSLLLFAFSSVVYAKPVTDTMVEGVGSVFLQAQDEKKKMAFEKEGQQGSYTKIHSLSGTTKLVESGTEKVLAYVLELEPKGFLVVSPDTDISPIIAYSFEGDFNWKDSESNVLLDMLRQDMENRIEALPLTSQEVRAKNKKLWDLYFTEDNSFLNELTEAATYGPLLSTYWNQSSPYNAYCPIDPVSGSTSIVGCVATAMAQIVNYHQYTSSVTFTSSDNYTTSTRGIYITASSASMSGISYPASTTTAARLSYACGVATTMDYTSSSSATMTYYVADALKNKFGFTSATALSPSTGYTPPYSANFYSKLQDNMKHGKPAQLAIAKSSGGGHSIVCDGYNSTTGQYHLNFGWGSTSPSPPWWYTLPSGMPSGYDIVKYGVLDIASPNYPSCPDLYAWNGQEYQFVGALFTRVHSAQSEDFQVQMVNFPVVPKGNALSFLIKEVDGEESYINSVDMFYRYVWAPANTWNELTLLSAYGPDGFVMDALRDKDDLRIHMIPGDEILLTYALPPVGVSAMEFSFAATGYYLWIESTWCEVFALGPQVSTSPGDSVRFSALINNMSTQPLPEDAVIWFTLGDGLGTKIGSVSAAGLGPGMAQWYSIDWSVPSGVSPGDYTYVASVFIGDSDITWKDEYYGAHKNPVDNESGTRPRCN